MTLVKSERPRTRDADASRGRFRAKIVVVEDEEALAALLEYNLEKEGYEVRLCADGDEALLVIAEETPDLVVLDWMLPGVSGVEICRRIRARDGLSDMPIIMVTARGDERDKVLGLDAGADDYLPKPFQVSELIARIRAVLRRSRPGAVGDEVSFGDIVLNRETYRVRRGPREVRLGPKEFALLDCLLRRPGRVFSREQLLDIVWGAGVYVEVRTVDVHVGRLRKALNRKKDRDPIRTVRAAGYAFDETYQG